MSTQEHNEALFIGIDIPWEAIEGELLKAIHFTPLYKFDYGKVEVASISDPYASLSIEVSKYHKKVHRKDLPREVEMPVVHNLDFGILWKVFVERGVSIEEEVVVAYAPLNDTNLNKSKLGRLFISILPRLNVRVYPQGSLGKIYKWCNGDLSNDDLPHPILEYDSRPIDTDWIWL